MKKVFVSITLMVIIFSSCEKKEVSQSKIDLTNKERIVDEAKQLSVKHDSLVVELLSAFDKRAKQCVQGTNGSKERNPELQDFFEVIEEVTGIKPEIVQQKVSAAKLTHSSVDNDIPVYDFDQNSISLTQYASSSIIEPYYEKIDLVINDSMLNVTEKIMKINDIQQEMKEDCKLSLLDFQNFINSTEVLKSSLSLWNSYQGRDGYEMTGIMKIKPISKWTFFEKLAFVAAADAVGAVVGTFIGSYLIVNGVPIYIPAGPQGACAGLAVLSVLAAKMVGW